MTNSLFRSDDSNHPWIFFRAIDDWGIASYELARPPGRFWSGDAALPTPWRSHVDAHRVKGEPSPIELLAALPAGDNWHAMSRRSQDRLFAWFLVAEDPQRRLDSQPISTLAHQASLVQHVLQDPHLTRVLIADEVGLGKTVEAALVIKHLLERQRGLRVLYLAPARLVGNVRLELERLGLHFRIWVAGADRDARLTDPLVVASIHRAVGEAHYDELLAQSWDVLVVDECHHLSAWAAGGQSARRKYKLVDELRQKLSPAGRLLLMSGTPHQGHQERFENVLRLLETDGQKSVAGRVIYRTKEDVRDWNGQPLFPRRLVHPPIVLDLGPAHRKWLERIHDLFEPASEHGGPPAQRRAAGWRAGQALQWATSSIEAGLGYLVRQAIRVGWDSGRPKLRTALEALRPYRRGPLDEQPSNLVQRIRADIGYQLDRGGIEDMEDLAEDSRWQPDEAVLEEVLDLGVALLVDSRDAKWEQIEERVLALAGDEKVVLFAQPIETVSALSRYLERRTGRRPAIVIGGQTEDERQEEIRAFWRADGPQYLVSSRAGGEGLNLQVARRLVHVDVPWNPMEMEQRVGRVHRFMSRKTILVDTVVVKDSREQHMYETARAKLREVAAALSLNDERFEQLFTRVMALVQPDDLQSAMAEGALGPLSHDASREIARLVQEGFRSWQDFHEKYAQREHGIRELDPGLARWADLEHFASTQLGAQERTGFHAMAFELRDGEVVDASRDARVLSVDGQPYACGDHSGMPVTDGAGATAQQFGLNLPFVTKALRALAFPAQAAGAAHLRWPEDRPLPAGVSRPFAALVYARMSVRFVDHQPHELDVGLRCFVGPHADGPRELDGADRELLLRGVFEATVRREPESGNELLDWLAPHDEAFTNTLRKPVEAERQRGVYPVIVPLLVAVIA